MPLKFGTNRTDSYQSVTSTLQRNGIEGARVQIVPKLRAEFKLLVSIGNISDASTAGVKGIMEKVYGEEMQLID